MRILSNYVKILSCSAILAAGIGSCTKKPFVEMPSELISKETKEQIDTFRKESAEILNDSDYIEFAKDTLRLSDDFLSRAQSRAKKYNENIVVGKHIDYKSIWSGRDHVIIPTIVYKKEPKYLEPKIVVKDSIVLTTDSNNIYLPVSYYGKLNPKSNIAN